MVEMSLTPIQYVDRIQEFFNQCRQRHLDRYSEEWGRFSVKMNRQLMSDMGTPDRRLRCKYSFVFEYWIELSRSLGLRKPDLKRANDLLELIRAQDPAQAVFEEEAL